MEKEKEPTTIRGASGSGVSRASARATRGRPVEKSPSKATQPTTKSPNNEVTEPSRGGRVAASRGSRVVRRGQTRTAQRRNRRMRQQPSKTNRLRRAQDAARNNQRGQRGRFRARRRFFVMRRRPYSRRSIFIAGLPRNINSYRLNGLIRKEGRLLRCTLLRDRFGRSRGIAFAEFQNPRDAWNVVQKWRGRNVGGRNIFVTFKRNPNRFRSNYSRFNRYGNRQFSNYGGYNSRYQRPNRPRGNRGRGRGRGF
jgi:hypothetical protein